MKTLASGSRCHQCLQTLQVLVDTQLPVSMLDWKDAFSTALGTKQTQFSRHAANLESMRLVDSTMPMTRGSVNSDLQLIIVTLTPAGHQRLKALSEPPAAPTPSQGRYKPSQEWLWQRPVSIHDCGQGIRPGAMDFKQIPSRTSDLLHPPA